MENNSISVYNVHNRKLSLGNHFSVLKRKTAIVEGKTALGVGLNRRDFPDGISQTGFIL